jgi:hypothetical protein
LQKSPWFHQRPNPHNLITNKKLCDGAQGTFLLPKLLAQDVCRQSNKDEVLNLLLNLPKDLQEYYMKILRTIPIETRHPESFVLSVLTWLGWARGPLSLAKIHEALSIKTPQLLNLETELKQTFGCLVSIDKGYIKLSHNSIRRFLSSPSFSKSTLRARIIAPDPEYYLAETCSKYLFSATPSDILKKMRLEHNTARFFKDPPFLRYACVYWLSHFLASHPHLSIILKLKAFVFSDRFLDWCQAVCFTGESLSFHCRQFPDFAMWLASEASRRRRQEDEVEDELMKIREKLWRVYRFAGT